MKRALPSLRDPVAHSERTEALWVLGNISTTGAWNQVCRMLNGGHYFRSQNGDGDGVSGARALERSVPLVHLADCTECFTALAHALRWLESGCGGQNVEAADKKFSVGRFAIPLGETVNNVLTFVRDSLPIPWEQIDGSVSPWNQSWVRSMEPVVSWTSFEAGDYYGWWVSLES
eukprot:SAG31_NODE_17428_length_671_cov_0.643357_1_plen_174_part_00